MTAAAAAVTEACKEDREDTQERASIPRGRAREIFTKGSDGGGGEGNPSRGCTRSKDTES